MCGCADVFCICVCVCVMPVAFLPGCVVIPGCAWMQQWSAGLQLIPPNKHILSAKCFNSSL